MKHADYSALGTALTIVGQILILCAIFAGIEAIWAGMFLGLSYIAKNEAYWKLRKEVDSL